MRRALLGAIEAGKAELRDRDPDLARGSEPGFYLEIQAEPGQEVAVAGRLGNATKKIELVAVKEGDRSAGLPSATVFVPERAFTHFPNLVSAYLTADTKTGRPKNEGLVARMVGANVATVRSLWTDEDFLFPEAGSRTWWEIWVRSDRLGVFQRIAHELNVRLQEEVLQFPGRLVVTALATQEQLWDVVRNSDCIAELRLARAVPTWLFGGAEHVEEWLEDLAERIDVDVRDAPAVTILDTGVNQGHPVLAHALAPSDMFAYDPAWGTADSGSHGTGMAGIALLGDLTGSLASAAPVRLNHILESVKILPPVGANDPMLFGAITADAASRVEVNAPQRNRVFCMAVTSDHIQTHGRPTSWSAAVDQLAFNRGGEPRLFCVSVGNIRDGIYANSYLVENDLREVEDPAQAWNALAVGSYTDRIQINDPVYGGWAPIAPAGNLSPTSRTSVAWQRQWPVKPDVVLEGGNLAADPADGRGWDVDDLQLITTNADFPTYPFRPFGETSAAVAECSRYCAIIARRYPTLWAETIRALIVHSANWTDEMGVHEAALRDRTRLQALLRRYGFGVPSIRDALFSARDALTLLSQDSVRPFELQGSRVATRHMNLHRLPWPTDVLENLGEEDVSLKVTLSYFVEPNPAERGWHHKYRYPSHGLRFAVKRPRESLRAFRERINRAARVEDQRSGFVRETDEGWMLGEQFRASGSIHCDTWTGSAVALANRGVIAVYPVGGWWKEMRHEERYDDAVRYSLVVSIKSRRVGVDIYTPVALRIGIPIEVE